jgi:ABC-type multidrug transport system ATPase subunit
MYAMYDEIVEFAELEKFMDQKLKNYSSGMQVRLAFSIAIRAKSDILLIDEVLAVGDEAFQAKCFDVFESYKAANRTVILVTHDMSIVKRFCNRALHISSGKISSIGSPEIVAEEYRSVNENLIDGTILNGNLHHNDKSVHVQLGAKDEVERVRYTNGDKLTISIDYSKLTSDIGGVGIAIYKSTGEYVFGANTFLDNYKLPDSSKKITYNVDLNISAGNYQIKAALFGDTDAKIVKFVDEGPKFIIVSSDQRWEGIVELNHKWSNQDF